MGLTKGAGCVILNKLSVLSVALQKKSFKKVLTKNRRRGIMEFRSQVESGQNLEK